MTAATGRMADPALLSMPMAEWPASDQAAWARDLLPVHPFDDEGPHYATTLRPESIAKTQKGYGRWLRFLDDNGWLDGSVQAIARVTRTRLAAYFRHLHAVGNRDYTIIGRFQELAMALRILTPGEDVSWVRRPWGETIYSMLPKRKRDVLVPCARVLFHWGLEMMDDALSESRDWTWRSNYRDGLLIAMLAARGRRRRSMQLLRPGKELLHYEEGFWVELQPGQSKGKKSDRFSLPDTLTPYIQIYLHEVRPGLLDGALHETLWITQRGEPLSAKAITNRIIKLSRKRFGQSFGPHRFRHAIGTLSALEASDIPELASAVLNISPAVADGHYIVQPEQIAASLLYAEIVQARRRGR